MTHTSVVRASDLRLQFFHELKDKLDRLRIRAIIKTAMPVNGAVIKLNGIALYKILTVPNPFKDRGVAIYRKITQEAIFRIGGKRAKGKNGWVGAPLTHVNYNTMMEMLVTVAENANRLRNSKMTAKKHRRKVPLINAGGFVSTGNPDKSGFAEKVFVPKEKTTGPSKGPKKKKIKRKKTPERQALTGVLS